MTLAELAQQAYPDPNECDTIEQYTRARHEDIAGLTDQEIARERRRAWHRWTFEDQRSEWLETRLHRLDAEARRRQRGRR